MRSLEKRENLTPTYTEIVFQLIPIQCKECGLNFCLKHRFPSDHDCGDKRLAAGRPISQAAKAALQRQQKNVLDSLRPKTSLSVNARLDNGHLSEDEALARALEASLNDAAGGVNFTREQLDEALAEQLQRNEYMLVSLYFIVKIGDNI